MATTPKPPPAALEKPPQRDAEPPSSDFDRPVKLRLQKNIGWTALAINLASFALLFVIMTWTIRKKTDETIYTITVPLIALVLIGVFGHNRFWTSVDARRGKAFLDNLRKVMVVYTQGFHFTPWYFTLEHDVIDFQKHEIMECKMGENTAIQFTTRDGYKALAEVTNMFKRLEEEARLSHSLRFQLEDLRKWTLAVIEGRLSDLGARNTYETLLYYKAEAAEWVAHIFGTEKNLSSFELELGITVKNPILGELGLTPESSELFQAKARAAMVAEIAADLQIADPTLKGQDLILSAEVIAKVAERTIRTYTGIPKDAKVVALGDSGVAVAAGGGKKGK